MENNPPEEVSQQNPVASAVQAEQASSAEPPKQASEEVSADELDDRQVLMAWQTPAYRQMQKPLSWYVIMGAILALFVIYDLWSGGWIVSITFLILAAVYALSEMKTAPILRVSITELGIQVGGKMYPYSQIRSFWLITDGIRHLHFTTYKGSRRHIDVMMPDDINLVQLREYLMLQATEEEGRKEAFSDQLIRNLGL